jgi:hypothetical protein
MILGAELVLALFVQIAARIKMTLSAPLNPLSMPLSRPAETDDANIDLAHAMVKLTRIDPEERGRPRFPGNA